VTRTVVAPAAAAAGLAACVAAVLARSGLNVGLTYAGTTWIAALATLAAALALVAAAPLARTAWLGLVAVCAGLSLIAPITAAWAGGPPVLKTTSTLAAALTFPLLAHLALAAPRGRLDSGAGRVVVAAAYAWSGFLAITLALVREPFYDPNCWNDCGGNAFLVRPWPGLSAELVHLRPRLELALGIAVLALGVRLLVKPGALVRASGLAAGAVGAAAILHAMRLLGALYEDPFDPEFRAIFFAECAAAVLVSVAVVAPRAVVPLRRRAVARVVAAHDDALAPRELEQRLGDAFGDPILRIVFWIPELGRSVDAAGADCAVPVRSEGRGLTPLVRGGETVAWIEHDASAREAVEPALTPAVRLAVDNARLRAGLLAQLRDLREARRTIVADGDDERRRLERDLHDGVQQLLLAVIGDLRTAAAISRQSNEQTTRSLEDAVSETAAVLEEVRVVAHGIYPAILTDAGLAAAVASLADIAAIPVAVGHLAEERYPPAVEAAAYQVVAESIANAATHSGASVVVVDVTRIDGTLLVRVHDDGHGGAELRLVGGLAELVDRVGAVGGTLSVESDPASGTTIGAVIPCAS
jgi:signal transduction histidine kinase